MFQCQERYDVIVIGAGVVGCAIARELSRFQLDILVIEKEDDVASGTSKANSGVLHAGFNVPTASLKAKTNVDGRACFEQLHQELHFPMRIDGKLVIAKNDEELPYLEKLLAQGLKNGVKGLAIIDHNQIKHLEPNVEGKYALFSALTGVISPYQFTIALAENAAQNGTHFLFDEGVTECRPAAGKEESNFTIVTSEGNHFKSRWVINAAGLAADKICQLIGEDRYTVCPCKGEYFITDKVPPSVLGRPIYPVPPKHGAGLGVHLTVSIDRNVLIGPSAEYCDSTDDIQNTQATMQVLKNEAYELMPVLRDVPFIRSYVGIRPKLIQTKSRENFADFVIQPNQKFNHFIELVGIESPGLTASPAIAKMIVDMIGAQEKLKNRERWNPERKTTPSFHTLPVEEQVKLADQDPLYREIICRCELVTKREVVDAINNTLGVTTLDAIKRRSRSMMGRCQGGFCSTKIVDIMIREFGIKPEAIRVNNKQSNLFVGKIK